MRGRVPQQLPARLLAARLLLARLLAARLLAARLMSLVDPLGLMVPRQVVTV